MFPDALPVVYLYFHMMLMMVLLVAVDCVPVWVRKAPRRISFYKSHFTLLCSALLCLGDGFYAGFPVNSFIYYL